MLFRRVMSTLKKSFVDQPCTIAVEGNIGSGKSTFLKHIEKLGKVTVFSEPLEKWRNCHGHNLLDLLYKDPKKNSFTFQSYVQLTLLQAHTQPITTPFRFLERSIYSARYCFVEKLKRDGLLSPPEFSVIDEWFKYVTTDPKVKVDLFVYLRTDPEVVYERILKRNRSEERTVSFEYIQSLHEIHEDWLNNKIMQERTAPVFTIDANVDLSMIGSEYIKFEDQILNQCIVTV